MAQKAQITITYLISHYWCSSGFFCIEKPRSVMAKIWLILVIVPHSLTIPQANINSKFVALL